MVVSIIVKAPTLPTIGLAPATHDRSTSIKPFESHHLRSYDLTVSCSLTVGFRWK